LIAGVAHELNNPLTAIMGYAQLLQTTEGVGEDVLRDLSKIYMQAQRAARIVQNLLTFARQHKAERQLININEALERTLELRSYQLRVENVEVVTQLAENVPGTIADPNQLQQVFLNLINNAQDAMTEYRGGGHLVVTTEFQEGKIRIKFRDNGPGLSPQAQKHLFEPFFTTKEVGKGTGLGLSICFGIVSQHGGQIWAESEPGQGTTFIVELPVVQAESARAGEKKEDQSPRAQGKLVLVVEDEEDVAMLLQRILSQDGHRVLLAPDGHVALDHLIEARKQGANFNLIISDIKMPGVNGPALYERVRQEMPDLAKRMVFITGDTMSPSTEAFLQRANLPYLAKPFTVSELRRAMASILEQPGA
jgi:two-component system, NtrC family, sensor kinase